MTRKLTEWPFENGQTEKVGPSDGCRGNAVPLAAESRSTISANLELIWEKSVHLSHASSGWSGTVLYFRRAASEDVVKAELSSGDAPVLFPDDEAGPWRRQGKRT